MPFETLVRYIINVLMYLLWQTTYIYQCTTQMDWTLFPIPEQGPTV